jgi:small multidrug resistance pump
MIGGAKRSLGSSSRLTPKWSRSGSAIVFEVIGTSALKASETFTRLVPSLVTLIAYTASFVFLALSLRTIPIGIAYAMWASLGIVLIALVGWFWLRQTLDVPALDKALPLVAPEPDLFDKQVSGTAHFSVLGLILDPALKVPEEDPRVDLLVLAQLDVMQSEGGAKLEAFHISLSAHVYRRLKAASCLIAVDGGA